MSDLDPRMFENNKFLKDLEKFEEDLPNIFKYIELLVKLHRKKYDEAIKEGFSPAQALELCKKIFL